MNEYNPLLTRTALEEVFLRVTTDSPEEERSDEDAEDVQSKNVRELVRDNASTEGSERERIQFK